jgi:hypothetical protein
MPAGIPGSNFTELIERSERKESAKKPATAALERERGVKGAEH